MFGHRADGVKVKNLDIIEKATPYFMPMRIDGVNYYTQPINCKGLDEFILKQRQENGVHYTYTEILMAACIRMLHERPKTNRFVNNCVIYQRKWINLSISIKKKLTDDGEEVTLKMPFTGRESLPEIKKIFDDEVMKNLGDTQHGTTKTAGILGKLPSFMFKFAIGFFRFLDKHNCLPKFLIKLSPFHTSIYVADLKSVKLDKVYHHLYNFGNTTIFATLGKVKYVPVSNRDGEISVEKRMDLGLSLDERVADGLYYSNSVRLLIKYVENPELLLEPLPEEELSGKALKKKQKQEKKLLKKQKKSAKN